MQDFADLVIVNASVHTMDPAQPHRMTDAVAIKDGRISGLGHEDVSLSIGPDTQVVDAAGGAVIPGINDAHLHFVSAAMAAFGYVRLDPDVAPDWATVVEVVAAAPVGEDGWVRAHGWDEALLGPAGGYLLDCRPHTPVVAFDSTGHQLLANAEALRRAGITATTPDTEGGVIVRAADGSPIGLLQDGAMELVSRAMPPVPSATLRPALLHFQDHLHALGITSLTEPGLGPASAGLMDGAGSTAALELLGDLAAAGELTLRINVLMLFAGTGGANAKAIDDGLRSGLAATYTNRGIEPGQLKIAGVKVFADGIPRSGTAWMSEPYGAVCTHGRLVIQGASDGERVAELNRILELIDDAGLQAGVHATGDAATAAAVEAISAASKDPGGHSTRGNRHYVIHGAFSDPGMLRTMASQGIGYSTNPLIRHEAGDIMRQVLGEDRFSQHQPLQSALEAGVHLNLASDAPVTSPDWRRTVVAAVRRATRSTPGNPRDPERISGLQALAAMTLDAAWQDHAEHDKGALIPGMTADLCLLSNPWPADEEIGKLLDTDVRLTLSGGRAVHRSTSWNHSLPFNHS
ncbi:putative amidohydrolase YtcJ [Paenarthrobacter nitroguajacolicus]|uniref:amidohydrolase n=1 Tax=Paenarthrobacter nitroguajacolicus TaxID=211146 RepID=UPI00285C072D|nr:amidohydrolase [Paenarthrobacter nitroguajacolicus]MDR6988840.1 putative amidohydrolase YtcJ [Paenarthrobacter nitroguajacolicus]